MKRFPLRTLTLLLVLWTIDGRAQDQGAEKKPTAVILRDQAASIAEEILDSLRLASDSTGQVSISVGGAVLPDIVENAMLEAVQRRGFGGVVLGPDLPVASPYLRLFVLEQTGEPGMSDAGKTGKSVRTTVEARVEQGGGVSLYLGRFSRVSNETRVTRENDGIGASPIPESDSFLEKVLEPLIVVTGAFLIVYLFFTVRS